MYPTIQTINKAIKKNETHTLMHLLLQGMQVSIFNVYSSQLRRNFSNESSDVNHVTSIEYIFPMYIKKCYP